MKFPQMLYQVGGVEIFEGDHYRTIVVSDDGELSKAVKVGWCETIAEARGDKPEKPADKAKPKGK